MLRENAKMTIVLLSDFGIRDPYVGIMKGVISGLAPKVSVIDLAHDVPAFDRVHAGLCLFQAFRYFPKETIFVSVVDPGVGSERRAILARVEDYYFIGPDNGTFTLVLDPTKAPRIVELQNKKYFLPELSSSFHGRDIFAPVAAHLSQGIPMEAFGPRVPDWLRLKEFFPELEPDAVLGRILCIDRFGNGISNLSRDYLAQFGKTSPELAGSARFPASAVPGFELPLPGEADHYSAVDPELPFLFFNSAGLLELAVNLGSAEKILNFSPGDPIRIPLKTKIA